LWRWARQSDRNQDCCHLGPLLGRQTGWNASINLSVRKNGRRYESVSDAADPLVPRRGRKMLPNERGWVIPFVHAEDPRNHRWPRNDPRPLFFAPFSSHG
jgi:hypothetical protein